VYWLPTPFASFPFISPPVRHPVPVGLYCLEVLLEIMVWCHSKPLSTFIRKTNIKWAKSKRFCRNVFFPLSSSVVIYLPFKFYNFVEILKFISGLKKTRHILKWCGRFQIFTFHFRRMSFGIIHSQLSVLCHEVSRRFFND